MTAEPVAAPRQAAIYTRISDDRGNDRLGVRRQERECRQLAAQVGWVVVDVYEDNDLSGYSGKRRPSFEAMTDAIRAGRVNAVLAKEPSRLTRHPRELEDLVALLDDYGVEVATHAAGRYDLATPGGRLTARILGSLARAESEIKSERVKSKMAEIATDGKFHGGLRPYGYEADGETVRPAEADVIRQMAAWLTQGLGLRRIQGRLNEAGVRTAQGKEWHPSVIRRILTSPRIAGLRAHQGEVIGEAAWPAIIDRSTWDEVQAILTDPLRRHAGPVSYLLTGLVFGPEGQPLRGADGYWGGPRKRRMYNAKGVAVDAGELDRYVVEYVLAMSDTATLPPVDERPPVSEVEAIDDQIDEAARMRADGDVTLREWKVMRERLLARRAEAVARVPEQRRVPAGLIAAFGHKGGLRQAWPDLSFDEQREALTVALARVVVHPAGRGRRTPVEDRTEIVPLPQASR